MSIDNLGAEWPSLMELNDFPFVEIKVDREFVAGCADNRLKQSVCRRILELADGFGARTVAEGVETRADFQMARELGFDLTQGFFFAKPMEAEQIRPAHTWPPGDDAELIGLTAQSPNSFAALL